MNFKFIIRNYHTASITAFEFYIFYEKENFEIENRITKLIVDWETDYCYFPEVFIYPLDTIESKALALPASAEEM